MRDKVSALLVHLEDQRFEGLQSALRRLSVGTASAGTNEEARQWLDGPDPPDLIFTDATLPDGTWMDVVSAAQKPSAAVKVVIVSPYEDHMLYVRAMSAGAVDFIVPPFSVKEVASVVGYALNKPCTEEPKSWWRRSATAH